MDMITGQIVAIKVAEIQKIEALKLSHLLQQ
jgi:hypothetical protein